MKLYDRCIARDALGNSAFRLLRLMLRNGRKMQGLVVRGRSPAGEVQ